ncbi:MAG: hypothetical protein HUK18_02495 [Bacteroidales bacterium]|nr:hypothetical protein [Bacteroidales bacterium]
MEFYEETVADTLKRIGALNEMAVPLKTYRTRVDGLRFQLVENWCLCKWCQMFSPECGNFAHWQSELKACIDNLKLLQIKSGTDKKKLLKRMLVDDYDYDETSMIILILDGKFETEHISDAQRKIVADEFANSIHGLIEVISTGTFNTKSYIQNTFAIK